MNIRNYLERIGYDKPVRPDTETLTGLHRTHMLAVPFENLDIHLGKPIRLTEPDLWEKIVINRRGGFCYELNGMFAWLLKQIGFTVLYLNGRVYNDAGARGREFDHLTLLVEIPGENGRWLADVGFGDSFVEPLRLEFSGQQAQGLRAFRLNKVEDGIDLWRRNFDGSWKPQYFFDLQSRNFPSDYEESCLYHQTSPKSSFTHEPIISRAKSDGRISLDRKNLTITNNGIREKRPVGGKVKYRELLKIYFGIVL
jgi:N-hydroxyarylamine O-acetyltransferase